MAGRSSRMSSAGRRSGSWSATSTSSPGTEIGTARDVLFTSAIEPHSRIGRQYVWADALQGPGSAGGMAGDGPRGRITLSGGGGTDPELCRREAGGGEALRAPALGAGARREGES